MSGLGEGIRRIISRIKSAPIIDEKTLREILRDIQRTLLAADVPVEIVLEVTENIKKGVARAHLPPGFSKRDLLYKLLYDELIRMLGGERRYSPLPLPRKPYVMMLVGIQGSGKTTTAAKLANFYKKHGYKVGLVAADTYRPGAREQLVQLGKMIGVPVFTNHDNDPVSLTLKGKDFFVSKGIELVIIDTAGRHKNEKDLLVEMRTMWEKVRPDEVVLVIDSTIGKLAGKHADAFHKATPLTTVVVTKMDGSARGGGALAAVVKTGARISFIGTGEKVDDIEVFDPKSYVSRLVGMGSLVQLVERFEKYEELLRRQKEISSTGKLTLFDLMNQLEAISSMGPLRKVLELLPGGYSLPPGFEKKGEENIKKWRAIMGSMTMDELLDPSIIDKNRMIRIARGSGTTPKDVKELLQAYKSMKKMVKKMRKFRGRMPL